MFRRGADILFGRARVQDDRRHVERGAVLVRGRRLLDRPLVIFEDCHDVVAVLVDEKALEFVFRDNALSEFALEGVFAHAGIGDADAEGAQSGRF